MRYKILIIDFDGTIADTRDSIFQTMKKVADTLKNNSIDIKQIENRIGLPLKNTFEEVFGLEKSEVQNAILLYRNFYNEISQKTISLFENVKEVLLELHKRGIILTIASSKGKKALTEIMKKHDIYDLFQIIAGEEDVEIKKPAPDLVLLILTKLMCSPNECLVVGDTIYDIEMGQRADVDTCGVTYGNNNREQLTNQKSTYVIDDFAELLNIV